MTNTTREAESAIRPRKALWNDTNMMNPITSLSATPPRSLRPSSSFIIPDLTSRTDVIEMEGMLTESDTLTDLYTFLLDL